MATRVWESTIVDAPVEKVWELVRPLNFSYLASVTKSSTEKDHNPNEVGSVRVVEYKDGTTQKLKLVELSDVNRTVSWDLVESTPPHYVLSASYAVRLRRITQGNATFVEWTVDFSNDATTAVIEDAKFKARDHFKALAAAARARLLAEAKTTPVSVGGQRVALPALKRQLSARSQQLTKLFHTLDKNGNGVLDLDEFAFAVNKLYGQNLPDEAIRVMLNMADLNGDRVIDYEEFVKFLASESLEKQAITLEEKAALGIKVFYFNGRGRAELMRLILAEANIPYEDVRFASREAWEKEWKARAPLGQAPWVEVAGGQRLAESGAIYRYLARVAGLAGKSPFEEARADMIFEGVKDTVQPFVAAVFEKDEKQKKDKTEKFFKEHLPTWAAFLEKQLESNNGGNGYFVGDGVTYADLSVYNAFSSFQAVNATCLAGSPKLTALIARVAARPHIAAWLARRPRTEF